MAYLLVQPGIRLTSIDSPDSPTARDCPGPAAIFSDPGSTASGAAADPDPARTTAEALPSGRPHAYREAGADWVELGYEAADHWDLLTPELRSRLIDDHLATLDVTEFKLATRGGSASIITNNWVYSGQPRVYRVAGELREFVTVLGEITAN